MRAKRPAFCCVVEDARACNLGVLCSRLIWAAAFFEVALHSSTIAAVDKCARRMRSGM